MTEPSIFPEYTCVISGPPKQNAEPTNVPGTFVPLAVSNSDEVLFWRAYKSKQFKTKFFIILIAVLLLVVSVIFAIYSGSAYFSTKGFTEDDFALVYSEGAVLVPESYSEVLDAVQKGKSLDKFSSATIIYSGKPSLIGYSIEVQNPEIIFVIAGKIYGLAEGRSSIYVYSQDGTYLTTREIIVEAA